MELKQQFKNLYNTIVDYPPLLTAHATIQEQHANLLTTWFDMLSRCQDSAQMKCEDMEELLEIAVSCSKVLFMKGDDITAWLSQVAIAEAAVNSCSSSFTANQYAAVARWSAYLFLHSEAQHFLEKMRSFFNDDEHALAQQYYCLQGLVLSLRQQWHEAIPNYKRSLEHLRCCDQKMIDINIEDRLEDLMANRLLHIADSWIHLGWQAESKDRADFIKRARSSINLARELPCLQVEQYLTALNNIELLLLEGSLDRAGKEIDLLLKSDMSQSYQVSILRPAVLCMQARLASLHNDRELMIEQLSLALKESIYFPNVLQELQIVDRSLELIREGSHSPSSLEQLFKAMVVMLEAKDWYTGRGHSKAVADHAISLWQIWQKKRLEPGTKRDLYWAGYLHDIGKLRLPRSLLNKRAPLQDREWVILRRHPDYGREILISLDSPHIAKLIGEHHQDSLGTGYPGTQPASDMGLCIAMADILEAATSAGRTYKNPKPIEQVLFELRKYSGKRYPIALINAAEKLGISSLH